LDISLVSFYSLHLYFFFAKDILSTSSVKEGNKGKKAIDASPLRVNRVIQIQSVINNKNYIISKIK